MKRIDRRTFMLVASVGGSGAVLTACGNTASTDTNLSPTMFPDVAGAPPTLAPQATPGGAAAEGDAAPAEEAPAEGGQAASGGAAEPIMLEAQDPYKWSATELEAAPGQIIQATNVGFAEHNFAVDEWGVETDLPPGEPVDITVPEDAEVGASFVYYCSVPGHRQGGMEGTLTIIEAAAAPAAAEEAPPESAGAGEPIPLEAQDPYKWSVTEMEAAPGQVIQATNVGFAEHNFAVDEWGVETDLPPGEPVDITVPEDAEAGASFVYYCSVPGHRQGGMEGTLTIIEAAAPPAAAQEAPAEGGQAAGGAGEPIALEAQDPYAWSVTEMEAAPGQVIQTTNAGFLEHNFAVDEWGIEEDLPPGEPVEITVPDDAEVGASFVYYCSVPGHREGGMEGTLTIVEASAAPAAGAGGQATPPASGEQAPATPDAAVTPPSASATPVAPPAVATPAPGTIALYAEDPNIWNPNTLTVSPGDTLSVVNTGVLQHDFTVDEWSVSQYLPNGGLVEIQVPGDVQSGQTLTFYCTEHRDQGMEGTLTIR